MAHAFERAFHEGLAHVKVSVHLTHEWNQGSEPLLCDALGRCCVCVHVHACVYALDGKVSVFHDMCVCLCMHVV